MTTLDDLISAMPKAPAVRGPDASDFAGVTFDPSETVDFVAPSTTSLETSQSPVVVLSAAGATGKSEAARYLASNSRSPLFDLSVMPVGTDTLRGVLSRVFGFSGVGSYVQSLRRGESSLVVDGLDEGYLSSGELNFGAFVSSLAELVSGFEPHGQVVLLGRPETIETTLIHLLDSGIEPAVMRLDPFTFDQACEYLEVRLDSLYDAADKTRAHRVHSGPFASFRDAFLFDMARSLDPEVVTLEADWARVADFLGYVPVLQVLAARIAEDDSTDFHQMKSQVVAGRLPGNASRGQILVNVLEGILDREADKVTGRLKNVIPLDGQSAVWKNMYRRDEQLFRIASRAGWISKLDIIPQTLPLEHHGIYEERIREFSGDHPFLRERTLRGVVFSDYVAAFLASAPLLGIRTRSSTPFLPSQVGPFFADFVHAMLEGRSLETEVMVQSLRRSFLRGARGSAVSGYRHLGGSATLELSEFLQGLGSSRTLVFEFSDPNGLLELEGPVSSLSVFTHHGVHLADRSGQLSIGPSVFIVAGDLSFDAEAIHFRSDQLHAGDLVFANAPFDFGENNLLANACEHRHDLKVISHTSEAIRVAWGELGYQWRAFQISTLELGLMLPSQVVHSVSAGIRRVLMVFKAGANGEPVINHDRMDQLVVASNPYAQIALSQLHQIGLVREDQNTYRLNLEKLAEFSVSYADLRSFEWLERLTPLVTEVLSSSMVRERLLAVYKGN